MTTPINPITKFTWKSEIVQEVLLGRHSPPWSHQDWYLDEIQNADPLPVMWKSRRLKSSNVGNVGQFLEIAPVNVRVCYFSRNQHGFRDSLQRMSPFLPLIDPRLCQECNRPLNLGHLRFPCCCKLFRSRCPYRRFSLKFTLRDP